ncbi:hypothetical protein BXZ70DRAFT_1003456 [Cristinia sonorae]|uniref:Uncharacterized protein n=1 Tax=Cristinia sonorae TaxID=1940300 RepID=A0A8K0V0H6_9AGAR|nr:hypothetical protein BXZ70DRAFT_1003456 [Cristinia sonorae]
MVTLRRTQVISTAILSILQFSKTVLSSFSASAVVFAATTAHATPIASVWTRDDTQAGTIYGGSAGLFGNGIYNTVGSHSHIADKGASSSSIGGAYAGESWLLPEGNSGYTIVRAGNTGTSENGREVNDWV